MNLILFEPAETQRPLPRSDRRASHILDVLRRKPGESFDAGLVNGPRGKGTLESISSVELFLSFSWSTNPDACDPVTLIVGLPRPQSARDILRDATTVGVAAIHFVHTEKTDPSYAQSTLWTSGEWRRHLVAGAEQAFDTRIPLATFALRLPDLLSSVDPSHTKVALDNYEAHVGLGKLDIPPNQPIAVAIGGERGWSSADRLTLHARGFAFAHLGHRVLRTETATIAALSILRMKLGLM